MFSRANGEYWHDYTINMVGEWELRNLVWINNFQVPLLVIMYSDLIDILEEQLLAVSVTQEKMECAMSR